MVRSSLTVALLSVLFPLPSSSPSVPAGYTETQIASGLQRPVALSWIPGNRLLIAEQYTGAIRMYKNGALQATPYATLSPINTNTNETGLLGMCVDPNFASNGYVYVFATQTASTQRIWRYTTVGDSGTNATLIVDGIPTNNGWHQAGGIGFGPDGRLYVAVGENGLSSEAQNMATWRGKFLRFNPDGTVPSDNPFGASNAIYSRGHRNPFRFTFRPSNGSLIATENGPNVDDEINRVVAGQNYGWPNYTGPNNPVAGWPAINPLPAPSLYAFATTIAITDICFYTGASMSLNGEMLVCDYKNGRIVRFTLDANDAVTSGPTDFVTGQAQIVDLEEGPDGALYYCSLLGTLWRVQASGAGNVAPTASFTASPTNGAPPMLVTVDASASADADGSIASYSWDWGDGSPAGSGLTASHTYSAAGGFTLSLTVTDNQGATGTASQGIVVSSGNLPPSAHVESATPASGDAPLFVQFAGHGHDDAGNLTHGWDFGDGSAVITYPAMASDANSSPQHIFASAGTFTVTLTITDAGGLTATNSTTIIVAAAPGTPSSGSGGKKRQCGLLGVEVLVLVAALRRGLVLSKRRKAARVEWRNS